MMVVGIMMMSTAARGPKALSRPAESTAPPGGADEEEVDGSDRAGHAAAGGRARPR